MRVGGNGDMAGGYLREFLRNFSRWYYNLALRVCAVLCDDDESLRKRILSVSTLPPAPAHAQPPQRNPHPRQLRRRLPLLPRARLPPRHSQRRQASRARIRRPQVPAPRRRPCSPPARPPTHPPRVPAPPDRRRPPLAGVHPARQEREPRAGQERAREPDGRRCHDGTARVGDELGDGHDEDEQDGRWARWKVRRRRRSMCVPL